MPSLITLSGDHKYEPWKIDGLNNTVINASNASWIVANIGSATNLYPVSVRDSGNVTLTGGTIYGQVSLTLDWADAYVNSAAVMARNVANVLIQDWTISRAWDAIRLSGSADNTFTIDNVWLTDIRDDGIENDYGQSGTVKNSLFDGVFVGISLAGSNTGNQTANVVTMDNVLIRMKSFEYKGELTHQSIFKTEVDKSPALSLKNCVFAIEDVSHRGLERLEIAWDSVISSSNNYFLNLSDIPLPADYPMPPAGFTILQGAEARAFWANARNDWVAQHNGTLGTTGGDLLTGGLADEVIFAHQGNDTVYGNSGDDRLFGQVGDDILIGGSGADTLAGGGGNDFLFGGSGADRFQFLAIGDDRVKNYQQGVDELWISQTATGGKMTGAEVISSFASVVNAGVLIDFGQGDTILLSGLTTTAGLADDLTIF